MLQLLGTHSVSALAAKRAIADQAEAFAGLQPQRLTNQHVAQLLSLLPRDPISRGDPGDEHAHVFTVGAFVHGVVVGVRERTFQFPQVAALLCRFVQQFKVAQQITIAFCFRALMLHSTGIPTVILLFLISWRGCLQVRVRFFWLSHLMVMYLVLGPRDGWELRGHLLNSPALFDTRKWHCSSVNQDLSKRIVLVAFCIRNAERPHCRAASLLVQTRI